jgi:hypothetical protein
VPCLFALGCSLEVAGNGPGTRPLEAGTDSVEGEGRGQGQGTDAQSPAETSDSGRPPPVVEAGSERDARIGGGAASDARVETDAKLPDAGREEDASTSTACDLEGRFALRFEFDVSWVGTEFLSIVPVIEAGQGALSFLVLMELASTAAGFDAAFRTCSSDVPGFEAAISGERYQARIDDETWDSDAMPLFSSKLAAACLEPGCGVVGEPLYALVGSALPSLSASWPLEPDAGEWPDHDGNREPGIATRMLGPSDGSYAYPPLDLLSVRRLRELALGLRVIVGFEGTLDSCDELSGATAQGGSIETRAVGCTATSAPLKCTGDELDFLNNNLPVWTAHQGSFKARRLAPDADCAEARGAFGQPRPGP